MRNLGLTRVRYLLPLLNLDNPVLRGQARESSTARQVRASDTRPPQAPVWAIPWRGNHSSTAIGLISCWQGNTGRAVERWCFTALISNLYLCTRGPRVACVAPARAHTRSIESEER